MLELERERQKEERQQQLELKKLELELSRASDPSAHPTDPPYSRPPPFRVEAAVKLVPKFSESDVETFLISFYYYYYYYYLSLRSYIKYIKATHNYTVDK